MIDSVRTSQGSSSQLEEKEVGIELENFVEFQDLSVIKNAGLLDNIENVVTPRQLKKHRRPPGPWLKSYLTTQQIVHALLSSEVFLSFCAAVSCKNADFWPIGINAVLAAHKKPGHGSSSLVLNVEMY